MTTMPSTEHPLVQRILPAPSGSTTIAEAYAAERPPANGRPWMSVCMIASLDGSVTIDGTSGGLGNANDREVLLTLRRLADVVIVGAATARGEGYGPPDDPRTRIGVVTNSGRVDVSAPLFRSGSAFVITSERAELPNTGGVDVVRAGLAGVDLGLAMRRLTDVVPDAAHVHAEGGPTLNGALFAADLVDELDLTIAPVVVGGDGPRLTAAAAELDRRFEPAHLLVDDDGYTFGRWLRRRD